MKVFSIIIIFLVHLFYLNSCTYQNEEEYFGESICDSNLVNRDNLEVYYDDVSPIFSGICQQCHNSGFTYRDGIVFGSYASVINSVNTGKVLPAIKHEGNYNMPDNQPKLPDCDIQKVAIWIENGMPEKPNK